MFALSRKGNGILLVVVVCGLLAASGAMAQEDSSDFQITPDLLDGTSELASLDPELCIELTMECFDAPASAGVLPVGGVVTNCGDETLAYVRVRDAQGGGSWYIDGISLAPGESASWSGEYGFYNPDECPVHVKVVAFGWAAGLARYTQDLVADWCDCPSMMDICRTPGFWGTRAGTEKLNSQNITQAVIDAAPAGLMVCGQAIDNTSLDYFGSAQEAMCVHPRSAQILQLARHLTAAALNCVVSGSPMDCEGTGIDELFTHCNDICVAGTDAAEINYCYTAVDCWNNGGRLLDNGMCQMGTCALDGAACKNDNDCGFTLEGAPVECVLFTDTCHDQPLVNEYLGLDFSDPGPAGSSGACNDAIRNDCDFFEGCSY
jgi:hypothetical protein